MLPGGVLAAGQVPQRGPFVGGHTGRAAQVLRLGLGAPESGGCSEMPTRAHPRPLNQDRKGTGSRCTGQAGSQLQGESDQSITGSSLVWGEGDPLHTPRNPVALAS